MGGVLRIIFKSVLLLLVCFTELGAMIRVQLHLDMVGMMKGFKMTKGYTLIDCSFTTSDTSDL